MKWNRNTYSMLLLDWILNGKLSKPFTQAPPDYDLPILNKSEVLSQLSLNFKEFSKKCFSEDSKDNQKYDNFKENFNPQIVYRSMNQNSAQKLCNLNYKAFIKLS